MGTKPLTVLGQHGLGQLLSLCSFSPATWSLPVTSVALLMSSIGGQY